MTDHLCWLPPGPIDLVWVTWYGNIRRLNEFYYAEKFIARRRNDYEALYTTLPANMATETVLDQEFEFFNLS